MKLTTKGFKAHDRVTVIEELSLFTGPNGAGKTSIADALRFVALGYIPSLGKRPVDTAALMANGSMEAELSFPDGLTIRRGITKTPTGYQQSAEASWLRNAKPSETAKEILGLFGNEELDVAECLDIRQLLSAPPNQRAGRIEQLLDTGKRPASETAAAVARFTLMRLVSGLDEANVPENYMDLLPLIAKGHKAVLVANAKMLESKISEAGIAGALTWANEEKRLASTGLKQKEEAAHQMRLRAAQVPEPDPRDIERLESERDRLQQDLGALTEKARQYEVKAQTRKQLGEAYLTAEESAAKASAVLADVEKVHSKPVDELSKRSEQVLIEMAALKTPVPPDASGIRKLEAELDALNEQRDAIKMEPVPEASASALAVKELEYQISKTKESPWAEVLEIALELKKAKDQKTRGTRLEKLAREGLGTDVESLEHELERAQKVLRVETDEAKRIQAENDAAAVRRQAIETKVSEKVVEIRKLRAEINALHVKAVAEFDEKKRRLLSERQTLESKIAWHRQTIDTAKEHKAMASRRMESLADQLKGAGELPEAPGPIDAQTAIVDGVKAELAKLIDARAVHAEIQRALAILDEAKAARDVYAAIEWALQRQREIEISEAGGPLKKVMATFLEAAGRKEAPFIEAGAAGIGWITPEGRRVQVQALSGGEWALFTAALTAAVVSCRNAKIKILLIEAGEPDRSTLTQLLEGVKAVVRGLDAAIVLTPHSPDVVPKGWNVVTLVSEPVAV